MEQVKFIEPAPDCRSCVYELEHSSKRRAEVIIAKRKSLAKCRQCERLRLLEVELNGKA